MKKLIGVVIIIVAGLFLLESILGQNSDQRNYQYFDEMTQSFAYRTQSVNPHLPNGLTQQAPVAGTIPRGYFPLHYGNSEEELIRAGKELINPFAADTLSNVERGQVIYDNFCLTCHGAGGEGDGPVAKRGYPPPISLSSEQTFDRTDGQMFHIITYGYKNMPPYASQVDREDRWYAINYIRQLQQTALQAQEAQNDTLNSQL